jgi:hypothetical protein
MTMQITGNGLRSQLNPPAPNAAITMECLQPRKASGFNKGASLVLKPLVALFSFLWAGVPLLAADFAVTSPGGFYSINSQSPNPTLTLVRGKTYTFAVSTASNHPFQILNAGTGTVVGNNTSSGTITYTVATNAPATFSPGYRCSIHNFSGIILTVDPPPPPVINIVSLSVSSNLLLRSTGTNGWNVLPEFKTNLVQTNWFALTVLTNRLVNGTNETICGKPAGDTVLIRIRSQPN